MRKDDLTTVQARKILRASHKRLKSWAKVAKRFGLANKARAFKIAEGTLRPNPDCDARLLSEAGWFSHPARMRRFVRKIAVPFLEKRQRSRTRLYRRGGLPWQGW